MKSLLFVFLVVFSISVQAQDVEIPEKIQFANLDLKLTDPVRKVLKSEVEAIKRNPKYFQSKVERANLYFPIIEKIFREENFPEDFKYLALQESSLVSDAVSSSNAVGYWQFKKESAQEVGLRVDNEVDERINIVSSTLGAAKYLSKNNASLNNWVYALLAYNLGGGGVKSHVESKYIGARSMVIEKDMHWYVIRFLAHKIAYENEVGKAEHPELKLLEYKLAANKSIKEISKETGIAVEDLEFYNKWILKSKVPDDKQYTVILPARKDQNIQLASAQDSVKDLTFEDKGSDKKKKKSKIRFDNTVPVNSNISLVHGLKVIVAKEGESVEKLAARAGVGAVDIIKYNELRRFDKPQAGRYYYVQPKRSKALALMHTVKKGETLWDIAQQYGIHTRAIRKKNRLGKNETLEENRVLWLRNKMPRHSPIQYANVPEQKAEPTPIVSKKVENKPAVVATSDVATDTKQQEVKPVAVNVKPADEVVIIQQGKSFSSTNLYHTVENGETLYSISKKYNVSVDSLIVWNSLTNTSLKTNQKLLIGKGESKTSTGSATEGIVHIAEAGDTIYKISKMYNVSVTEIVEWNEKQDYNISVGERIIIRK